MSANRLLTWMSARREGSWQQFRASAEQLHIGGPGESDENRESFGGPIHQLLRFNLQRYGHAEFFEDASEVDWRVTPPCIATNSDGPESIGVLVGARSDRVLQSVRDAAAAKHVEIAFRPEPDYPDLVLLGPADQLILAEVARSAGVAFQRNAPQAILAQLPQVSDAAWRFKTDFPMGTGWRVDRFSPELLRWQQSNISHAATSGFGLYRFTHGFQRYTLLKSRGELFSVQGQVGKYLTLRERKRRRAVLRFNRLEKVLSVSSSCRPPHMIERALVLCSGVPPTFENGELRYRDVIAPLAHDVAAILGQELA